MKNLKQFDLDDFRQENYHTTTNPKNFTIWILREINECCISCMRRYNKHENNWKTHRKTQYKEN